MLLFSEETRVLETIDSNSTKHGLKRKKNIIIFSFFRHFHFQNLLSASEPVHLSIFQICIVWLRQGFIGQRTTGWNHEPVQKKERF